MLRPKKKAPEFWVTNINPKKDVALGDLRVTIPAAKSVNLLSKHYNYTLEQLEISAQSGSIYRKRKFIKVRNVPYIPPVQPGLYVSKDGRYQKPLRSQVEIIEKFYEDLELDVDDIDETYADDNADLDLMDHAPTLGVDDKFKGKE